MAVEPRRNAVVPPSQRPRLLDGARGLPRDLFALQDLGRRLTLAESLRMLERTIVDRSVQLFRADCGGLLLLGEGDDVRLVCHDECPERPPGVRALLTQTAEPEVLPLAGNPCPTCVVAGTPRTQTIGVPLLAQRRRLGSLFLTFRSYRPLSRRRRWLLLSVANEAASALRNLQLYLWSEERAIMEERARIAREIHDGLLQSLAGKLMKISLIERLLERDLSQVPAELEALKQSLRADIQEIRHSVLALRPLELESQGLERAVENYARDFAEETGIRVTLHVDAVSELGPKHQTAAFRLLQEALNNVRKHARAQNVRIELARDEDDVRLLVWDDGAGFDVATARRRQPGGLGGLGLLGMEERVRAVGGSLHITSRPGSGTTIEARMPLRREGDRIAGAG